MGSNKTYVDIHDSLTKDSPEQRLNSLPHYLKSIMQTAIEKLDPEIIWIFGSHARGDAEYTSDIDIAFRFSKEASNAWTRFVVDTQENADTL